MPLRTPQRVPTEAARLRGRVNTTTTTASKTTTISTARRTFGPGRHNSSLTTTSNADAVSTVTSDQSKQIDRPPTVKIIQEVDETNIDEVLSMTDPSMIPHSFLTEIQQDEIYSTILEELQKKFAQHLFPSERDDDQKLFSPQLFDLQDSNDDNDENLSVTDETISSVSSEGPEDYDTDIEPEVVQQEVHDPSGRTQYKDYCQTRKLVPCSYFLAHVEDNELILRYHQFSTEDIRAITKALANNLHIERLHLDGNYLQEQAAKHIATLLLANDSITDLSLAGNRLGGGTGTQEICRMLVLNQYLKRIDLSGNRFNELDIVQLIEAFEKNKILRELNLSHNSFGEACGKVLGTFISGNYCLESLDLSWNNFRGKNGIELINGVKENTFLKRCNLEMNGLGPESGPSIAECIKQNNTLKELNISGNRLNTPNAFSIALALKSNTALQVLKMADNDINTDGILALLFCIKAHEATGLRELDLSHMVITKDIHKICDDLVQMKGGDLIIRTGKEIREKLPPNSISECYMKTDLDTLKGLARAAGYSATEHDPPSWLSFT